MKIVQLSPGAGDMYCGNCLRDNALAGELVRQGHDLCMVPLYLPLTLDEEDRSRDTPVFFSGVNVYLEQKLPIYRYAPRFLRRLFASKRLLKAVGGRAAGTHPSQVGDLTVSMLRGEHGRQATELTELCRWLKPHEPEVVSFSNALLLGMHGEIKAETGAKTVCFLTGEDAFLDGLTEPYRTEAWDLVRKHAARVDLLSVPSRYFAGYMENRLALPPGRVRVLPPGLNLDGYENTPPILEAKTPVLGYFARLNHGKGLDVLAEAFVELRRRGRFPNLRFEIGGAQKSWDLPFLTDIESRLTAAGLREQATIHRNVTREEKIALLRNMTLFSVPTRLNEAFGLFVLESHAAGVPGLFPDRGVFPEILAETGGGLLFEPENPISLADTAEELLGDEPRRRRMAQSAKETAFEQFNIARMARRFIEMVACQPSS